MTTRTNSRGLGLAALAGSLALLAGVMSAPVSRAEVSINGQGEAIYFQARPGEIWTRHRQGVSSEDLLNPFGDARGDGAPSIARNPFTDVWEVAWWRGGASPGVTFAHHDAELDAWIVRRVTASRHAGDLAGLTVQLVHDDWGNRFIGHADPSTGRVLLASAPRDTHEINRPIVLNPAPTKGSMPALHWDGEVLVIVYAITDGGVEILHLRPDVDDEGRIPNAGIGIPGIPDHQARIVPPTGAPTPTSSTRAVGGGVLGASIAPGIVPIAPPTVADPHGGFAIPSMVQIAEVWGERLLATWIESETLLGYAARIDGNWNFSGFIAMDDPVEHERARQEARRLVTGGNSPRR